MARLKDEIAALIGARSFGVLTSQAASGWPHSTVVWLDCDREHVLVNTRTSRRHYANLQKDHRCALVVVDAENPYHYCAIRATLDAVVEGEEAAQHIHALSLKYRGEPYHTAQPADRVILRLAPVWQRDCWSHRGRLISETGEND